MPKLILLIAIGIAVWIIYQRLLATPPAKRKAAYLKLGLGVLIAVVVIGVVTGRMHWLGAAITGLLVGASRLLPVLIRFFPMLQWLKQSTPSSGASGQSQVDTAFLKMTLDHETGDVRGEVLQGDFSGQQLDALDRSQLEQLLSNYRSQDTDSARLLESYLERRFGDDWGDDFSSTSSDSQGSNSAMNESEALAVLGLQAGASRDDIVAAHRSLMQKLHPDRGGNDYLAAKLNEAKDLLLS